MDPTDSQLPAHPQDEPDRFFMLAFDMCCLAGLDGYFRRVNPAFERGLGFSAAELMARPFRDLVHPDDVARTAEEFERIALGNVTPSFQNRYRHKDGSYRWLEWNASLVSAEGHVYAVARDVTEQRRVAEALKESEQRYRLLAENSSDVILLTSPSGEVQYASPACQHLLGYTAEELIGRFSHALIPTADLAVASQAHLAALSGETAKATYRVVTKDGRELWLEVVKQAIRDPASGAPLAVQAVSRDISERVEHERLREQFVSTVAHELRTPLSAVYASLRLLASDRLAEDPQASRRILDIAVTNTDRLARLIDDLLEFERLKSGRAVMDLEACNAENLLLQVEDTMAPIAEKAGVTLDVALTSLPLRADPDRVIQVLLNLVGNAIKFSPPGGPVRVRAWAEGDFARFTVEDEGRGIPAAMHGWIFERFHQVKSADSRDKGGAGLGLAISRGLVEAHGGRIGVVSQEGKGSTFWFTLPAPGV